MKKRKMLLAALLMLVAFGLSACGDDKGSSKENETEVETEVEPEDRWVTCDVENFKTHEMRVEEYPYPVIQIVRSKQELKKYLEVRSEQCSFDQYDEAFFEKRSLVLILMEGDSGSVEYGIRNVEWKDLQFIVHIDKIVPDVCTDDLVWQHLFLSVHKEDVPEKVEDVKLDISVNEPLVAYKPVIYLYPEQKTEVSVKLNLDGELTCTYPAYDNGWKVTAAPDGTLTDANEQTYNYLYWEGETFAEWDMSKGFCIKGEDTAEFLENALTKLGLTRREANEFIVYWLPLMQENPYNIISFQTDVYCDAAKLEIAPNPDTLIRVFMTYQASDRYVDIEEQTLSAPQRVGFTAVEWGGTKLP